VIVVAGGMIRSGSTFSFNIVREALALRGPVATATANSIDPSLFAHSADRHFVLKTHAPDDDILTRIKEGTIKCICTIRRPEDAIASWMRVFGSSLEVGIESIKCWLGWYLTVIDQVLTIDFQTVDCFRRMAILEILEYIGANSDNGLVEMLEAKYEKLSLKMKYDALVKSDDTVDVGFSYYDKETFLHRRHISSDEVQSAKNELSSDQALKIRRELEQLLGRDGVPRILKLR